VEKEDHQEEEEETTVIFVFSIPFFFPRVRQQRKWPIGHRPKTGRDISLSGEVVVVVVVGEMKTVIAKSWHKCVELYR
jgi:hypothetical protein